MAPALVAQAASQQPPTFADAMRDPNWWIVIITAILAGLSVWQMVLTRRAVKAAKDSAEAARDSADAAKKMLTVTHRPILVVHPIEIDGFVNRHIGDFLVNGRAWITNTGVLPASLQKFWCTWLFAADLPLENPAHASEEGDMSLTPIPPGKLLCPVRG